MLAAAADRFLSRGGACRLAVQSPQSCTSRMYQHSDRCDNPAAATHPALDAWVGAGPRRPADCGRLFFTLAALSAIRARASAASARRRSCSALVSACFNCSPTRPRALSKAMTTLEMSPCICPVAPGGGSRSLSDAGTATLAVPSLPTHSQNLGRRRRVPSRSSAVASHPHQRTLINPSRVGHIGDEVGRSAGTESLWND
jgi:hypothetical protein